MPGEHNSGPKCSFNGAAVRLSSTLIVLGPPAAPNGAMPWPASTMAFYGASDGFTPEAAAAAATFIAALFSTIRFG